MSLGLPHTICTTDANRPEKKDQVLVLTYSYVHCMGIFYGTLIHMLQLATYVMVSS